MDPTTVVESSKASLLRGYIPVLAKAGILDGVKSRVSPATRELMTHLPPASAWVDSTQFDEISAAIEAIEGVVGCRRRMFEATMEGQLPLLQSFVSGMLRVFGVSPHSLYSKMPESIRLTSRGLDVEYGRVSDHCARVRVRRTPNMNPPMHSFHGIAGGLEVVLHLCKVRGSVSDPAIVADARKNAADYEIRWQ